MSAPAHHHDRRLADLCAGLILGAAVFGRRLAPPGDPLRAYLDHIIAAEVARRRDLDGPVDLAMMNAGESIAVLSIEKAGVDCIAGSIFARLTEACPEQVAGALNAMRQGDQTPPPSQP